MNKNILIIGNGFDLAHGLPTKYSDFLDFCFIAEDNLHYHINDIPEPSNIINLLKNTIAYKNDSIADQFMPKQVSQKFINLCEITKSLISENIWYWYFKDLYQKKLSGENWIDFEREISHIIHLFDIEDNLLEDLLEEFINDLERLNSSAMNLNEIKTIIFINLLRNLKIHSYTFRKFRKKIFDDLQRLISALEFYLKCFVDKIPLHKTPSQLKNLNPEVIFSFNYTQTATKIYNCKKTYYLHGNCNELELSDSHNFYEIDTLIDKSLKSNNMVVGIDEYFSTDKKDTHTDYVIFKKFVQRIQKMTDKYDDNLTYFYNDSAFGDSVIPTVIHIFGHSLDVTDKDIFKEIFNNRYCSKIIIYCYDKPTQGEYIANIIKIIGQDELIKRTQKNTLEFVILN